MALALDHVLGTPDLLYGHRGAGVDGVTLLEFEESLPQQALVSGLQPFIDVPLRGLEAGLLGGHLVDHVGGVLGKGLFVRLEGGVPLLLGFAPAARGQVLVAFLGAGLQRNRRRDQHGSQHDSG